MAQVNETTYLAIADYYANIDTFLSNVAAEALGAVHTIVNVTTTGYTPADTTGDSTYDAAAALELELALLDVFNAAYVAVSNVSSNTGSLLEAVRAINNIVIKNYSLHPGGSETTADGKLAAYINQLTSQVPSGWQNLSEDAGYTVTAWTNVTS